MDENDFEEMWDRMDDIEREDYNKLMKSCCKQCEQCAYYWENMEVE